MNESSEWAWAFPDIKRNATLTLHHGLLFLAGLKPGEESRRVRLEEPQDRGDVLDVYRRIQHMQSPEVLKAEADSVAYSTVKVRWEREGLAGDRFTIREYVEWAQRVEVAIPWLDAAVRAGLLAHDSPSAVEPRKGGKRIANLDAIKMRVQVAARIYFEKKPYPKITAVMETPGFLTAINEGRHVSTLPASSKNVRAWISEIAPTEVRRGGRPKGSRNKPKPIPT